MDPDAKHNLHPSAWLYFGIWLALVVLTGLTFLSATLKLGALSTGISIAIASTKASLVLLFFMRLKDERLLIRVTFIVPVVTLAIFFILTYSDVLYR